MSKFDFSQLLITEESVATLPVKHLSPSAMRDLMSNKNLFVKKWIRGEFDRIGSPTLIVGNAVHKALEDYRAQSIIKNPEITLSIDSLEEYAVTQFNIFVAQAYGDYIVAFHQNVIPPDGITDVAAADKMNFVEKAKAYGDIWLTHIAPVLLAEGEKTPEQEAALEGLRTRAIDFGKTGSLEKSTLEVRQAIRNYVSHLKAMIERGQDHVVFATERSETVQITCPFTGEVLPLPCKGKIDYAANSVFGTAIGDYKTVGKFTDETVPNPAYEIAASLYYFSFHAMTGRFPDVAIFEEIMKKEPGVYDPANPGNPLYQADLDALGVQHGIDFSMEFGAKYVKNDQKKDLLLARGILLKEPPVKMIVYRFADRPDMLRNFLELYRRCINELATMVLVPYAKPLPNPYDMMSGKESWEEFVLDLEEGGARGNLAKDDTTSRNLEGYEF